MELSGSVTSPKRLHPIVFIFLALVLGILLLPHRPAKAAESVTSTTPEVGLPLQRIECGGGRHLNVLTLDASWLTDHDRVLVVDPAGDMDNAADPRSAADFVNDTWIFDAKADGRAELIITFATEGDHSVAYLYDDRDGDGAVSYTIRDCQVRISEWPFWHARVEAIGPWLLPSGEMNMNLTMQIDGNFRGGELGSVWPEVVASRLRNDGKPDTEWVIRDVDYDGIPEFAYGRLITDISLGFGIGRLAVMANEGRHRPRIPAGYVFWPLLGGAYPPGNIIFDSPPYFAVNWDTGRLVEFLPHGYPFEHGYGVNSLLPARLGEVNEANFENPMAYYDLANDKDGRPELHIRLAHFEAYDPFKHRGRLRDPISDVRFSWNQRNSPSPEWDYKIGLVGLAGLPDVARLGDLSFRTVAYERLPQWVVSTPWSWATFVAAESTPYVGSEGIYDLPGEYPGAELYLAGQNEDGPERHYTMSAQTPISTDVGERRYIMSPGLRGEWGRLNGPPRLYLSGVDRKLHLFGAKAGMWTISENQYVKYEDLNGDGYIDLWSYWALVRAEEQVNDGPSMLIALGDRIVHSGNNRVTWKNFPTPLALFEMPPPIDTASWHELGRRLEEHAGTFQPDDLGSALARFPGPQTTIRGASIRDVRADAGGFRFVLTLLEGFQVAADGGEDAWLAGLGTGSYIVRHEPGSGFHVDRLTPADVLPSVPAAFSEGGAIQVLEPVQMGITLRNSGTEDVAAVKVSLMVAPPEGTWRVVESQTVELRGASSTSLTFTWIPSEGGVWRIQAQAGERVSAEEMVVVLAGPSVLPVAVLLATTHAVLPVIILLLLVALLPPIILAQSRSLRDTSARSRGGE